MATLTIKPLGKQIDIAEGESVRDAMLRVGLEFDSPCNGKGICGMCKIKVLAPFNVPPTPHEKITHEQEKEGVRLACMLSLGEDATIEIADNLIEREHKILTGNAFDASAANESKRIEHLARERKFSPAAKIINTEKGSFLEYDRDVRYQLEATGKTAIKPKGLAVDIGTTTVVATLIDLVSGKEIATESDINPQVSFGHDVMSRIQAGSTSDGLAKLRRMVTKLINGLISRLCDSSGCKSEDIVDVVVGGNTTMLQLAAGIDPEPLGRSPFDVDVQGGKDYSAKVAGLNINSSGRVYVPPIIHAFIGSDISAGMLLIDKSYDADQSVLFIDIGTNGEIGLRTGGDWWVTSAAAGPAFEGMGVSSGMRAAAGAIEEVNLGQDCLEITTVANETAVGICGSGIVDLLAALLQLGIVEPSGRMQGPDYRDQYPPKIGKCIIDQDGKPAFEVAKGVYLTQQDVRQIQLAKSAVRTAVDLLLKEVASEPPDRVIIAGGFGFSLQPLSLVILGILPPSLGKKIVYAGNTSMIGCSYLLTDRGSRRHIEKIAASAKHLSLVEKPTYMEQYIEHMEFPEWSGLAIRQQDFTRIQRRNVESVEQGNLKKKSDGNMNLV
jgi:uncharacterized 2Fe-2S/4Fe-4S cluster protein (DUF4445 family)